MKKFFSFLVKVFFIITVIAGIFSSIGYFFHRKTKRLTTASSENTSEESKADEATL